MLFYNEAGQLTEMSIGNLVVEMTDGQRYTPPVSSGLLPGVLRQRLLDAGEITERLLRREDLSRSKAFFRINSVRGWERCRILPDKTR